MVLPAQRSAGVIGERRVALAHLGVIDTDFPDVVDIAADAGFDAITLRATQGRPGQETPLVTDPTVRSAVRERLRATGIGILDFEVLRLAEDTDLDALAPLFEAANELGVENLLTTGTIADEDRLVARFAELCAVAARYGVRPALEFMIFTECRTVQDATRVVERAGGGSVLVDPLHLARTGGTPQDVAARVEASPELFAYAQFCDAPLRPPEGGLRELYDEALHQRLFPGDGELPLRELLAALPPNLPLSVETPVWALRDAPAAERARATYAATERFLTTEVTA